jgi:hypothetical protein
MSSKVYLPKDAMSHINHQMIILTYVPLSPNLITCQDDLILNGILLKTD